MIGRRKGTLEGDEDGDERHSNGDAERRGHDVGSDDYDDDGQLRDGRWRQLHGRHGRHGRRHGQTQSGSPTDEKLLRHEMCFEPFYGYDDDYDGPRGILTSHLPDGTSTLSFGKLNLAVETITC